MSRRDSHAALAILTAINFLNYIDRYVPAAVFEPMKRDLHFTDAQSAYPTNRPASSRTHAPARARKSVGT